MYFSGRKIVMFLQLKWVFVLYGTFYYGRPSPYNYGDISHVCNILYIENIFLYKEKEDEEEKERNKRRSTSGLTYLVLKLHLSNNKDKNLAIG